MNKYITFLWRFTCRNGRSHFKVEHLNRIHKCRPLVSSCHQVRSFALKLYSQYIPTTNHLSDDVFEYIKSNYSFGDLLYDYSISNVYEISDGLPRMQSSIIHNTNPSPEDILKLFALYKAVGRSAIYSNLSSNSQLKILQARIESAILEMSFDELHKFAILLKPLMQFKLQIIRRLSERVFEVCLTRAEKSDCVEDIFKYFMVAMELYRNRISNKIGYLEFIHLFESCYQSVSTSQLCQIIYFMGLSKRKLDISENLMEEFFARINEMKGVELGLAVAGLFKMGLKTDDSVILSKISGRILDEYQFMKNRPLSPLESFSLVSLIKYLRICQYRDANFFTSLSKLFHFVDTTSLSPQLVCHLLALFANGNYYDREVYSSLSEAFFCHLSSPDKVVRIKDISRVMWALSHVQHFIHESSTDAVINSLELFSKSGDFNYHFPNVVVSLISLASYGIFHADISAKLFKPSIISALKEKKRSRFAARLLVLAEAMKVAHPSIQLNCDFSGLETPIRTISDEFFHRPSVNHLQKAASWLEGKCGGIALFRFAFLVPYINNCSLVLNVPSEELNVERATDIGRHILLSLKPLTGAKIAVDVNDENTSLDAGNPFGLEVLKRRLLRLKGWDVRVISGDDVIRCNQDLERLSALLMETIVMPKPLKV